MPNLPLTGLHSSILALTKSIEVLRAGYCGDFFRRLLLRVPGLHGRPNRKVSILALPPGHFLWMLTGLLAFPFEGKAVPAESLGYELPWAAICKLQCSFHLPVATHKPNSANLTNSYEPLLQRIGDTEYRPLLRRVCGPRSMGWSVPEAMMTLVMRSGELITM